MKGSRISTRLWRALPHVGMALGVLLLLLEGFDSMVTDRIDWMWLLLAAALLAGSWLEMRRGAADRRKEGDGVAR
jgi:hypothetical protein